MGAFFSTITYPETDGSEQIARGLLVRNHASALPMIVQVFGLFDQSGPFVERAAKSLRILADKSGERILSKDHYCTVKVSRLLLFSIYYLRDPKQPLYKQKLYNTLLPALIDGSTYILPLKESFPDALGPGNKQSTAQLLALGSIINTIPKSMIMSELPKVRLFHTSSIR